MPLTSSKGFKNEPLRFHKNNNLNGQNICRKPEAPSIIIYWDIHLQYI